MMRKSWIEKRAVRAHDGVRNVAEPVDFQVEISN